MPICTSCATELGYLYTVYDTAFNLRLDLCPQCKRFSDPYVEHDVLNLLLDLILLKREVYRHLVYNRGSQPRYVISTNPGVQLSVEEERIRLKRERWKACLQIGWLVTLADSFIRWTDQRDGQNDASRTFVLYFLCCVIENIFFHIGVNCTSTLIILLASKPRRSSISIDSSHISLALVYSSIAKNLLLFILAVWGVKDTLISNNSTPLVYLDPQNLPRQWIINNGLGGMAAGFGLRVILDCHPLLMTLIIFAGWATKTIAATVLYSFVWKTNGASMRVYSLP